MRTRPLEQPPGPRRPLLAALLAVVTAGALVLIPQPGAASQEPYLVGRGIADVTGEPAEDGMMGYARLEQRTSGLHQRQRSRAFVVADRSGGQRVAMVTADVGMIFGSVRDAVLQRLAQRYGSLYTGKNVLLTGTHTHAGPGGFSHYALYNITTFGYHGKTFDALVDGIVESIERAHDDLEPGNVSLARGELTNASVNRSRRAFDRDPPADKQHFPLGIDPSTTLMRVERGGRPVGAMNWFATHATSMSPDNALISGDNKGYAAYHWEHDVSGVNYQDTDDGFVSAFAQTNAGDMSPNLELRPGTGPTNDEFLNTQIIGRRQYDAASALMGQPGQALTGGVDSRVSYVDMSGSVVRPEFTGDGKAHTTCDAALGASFAAGAEDGPGPSIFHEGEGGNPFFGAISDALYQASPELKACQAPKDILLATGALNWTAKVLPVQLIRVGSLHLVSIPQEVTIVAGLRLRQTVARQLGVPIEDVLVAGYANDYAGYVTTPEEYDQQDYEAGHTMFGRWQLPAYQQEFARIAADMKAGRASDPGPSPTRNPSTGKLPLQPGVVLDVPQIGRNFGDVLEQPQPSYLPEQQVRTVFATANPNNDLQHGGSYLEVQRKDGDKWIRVADDGDWSTKYYWARDGIAASTGTITWDIPPDTPEGSYRVVHHGDAKDVFGQIRPFDGVSREFTVGRGIVRGTR
jgi:neutral ceramidase